MEWVGWLVTGGIGLGLFGWYSGNIKAMLAAAAIVACVVMGGMIYQKGASEEHARILNESKAKNAAALKKMEDLRRATEARNKELEQQVNTTPPGDKIAIKADRAGRIGAVR